MAQGDKVFVVSGAFDLPNSIKGLAVEFEAAASARPFDLLDCHDQSIRASGKLLLKTDGTLMLLRGTAEPLIQKGRGKGQFVQELPDGPIRAALKGFPKLRALMSISSGTLEDTAFAFADELQKTRVRGRVMSLSSQDEQVAIVIVRPVRGYSRAFQTVCSSLQEMTGRKDGVECLVDTLLSQAPVYEAKPEIRIGRDEPSIEVASDIIRTFLSVARQNEAGVIADIDTEFLHDYRVSLRRIRSVLSLFKGVFSPKQTVELKRIFARMMSPTGRVRDLDVYLLEKDQYFNLIPANLHVGAEAMFAQFGTERAHAQAELSQRLTSAAYEKQMNDLLAQFADVKNLKPGPAAERAALEYACELIWKRYRKVCKLARRITQDTPDEVIHRLRIECKKLRYLMEFFAPLFDRKDCKKLIKPLKKLQNNLGVFNDCSVQQVALLGFIAGQSNTQGRVNAQVAMAAGGLIAVLSQRQNNERDAVIANFRRFDSPKIQKLFHDLFHQS